MKGMTPKLGAMPFSMGQARLSSQGNGQGSKKFDNQSIQ